MAAAANMVKVQVQGGSGEHHFAQEEMNAFAEHITYTLKEDGRVQYLLPIKTGGLDLCAKVQDGVLLCTFINKAVPNTIDERAVNYRKGGKDISLFQRNENNHLMINSAKSIGVKTVNVGPEDMNNGENHPHIVLGVVWQLVKIHLLNSINLKQHPELVRLLEDGETLEDLLRLPPEQLLLRWFNYHLKNSGDPKRVKNFSGDVKDSYAYTILLNQIAPNTCSRDPLREDNQTKRAQMCLDNSSKLGVQAFVQAVDIAKGNPRLNLAYTAAIFNQCPGLDPLEEEELEKIGLDDDSEGDREERAFRMWINSLGLDDVFLDNLFDGCADGLVLLKVMDVIQPGIVDWSKVERKPNNKFKKLSNCNYAVLKGKELKFSLVNIGGSDIVDRNKTLVLALVWQMMRAHTLKFLAEVQRQQFGGKKDVQDQDIIDWANDKVKAAGHSQVRMQSFKDKSLADGVFFLELLRAVEPRVIDDEFVTMGDTEEDRMLNARYAISITRKLGGVIFLLPEDIVEVKPKMILTFVASIMSVAK